MNKWIKAASLGLILSTATVAAQAAQKVGFVVSSQIMQEIAVSSDVNGKLQREFKDRIAELQALEKKVQPKLEKLQRDGELMTQDERRKLEREIQAIESDYKLKAQALQEDQRRRGAEEEQKMVQRLQDVVQEVAEANGYDMVIDRNVVAFGDPSHNLTEKVIKAL
ncbi:OmpH family outer membrane protein [Thaumasiovibrio subtropicus]|uniref:OmpH family outer membrane protein n=1 Tax=Thaumasiovibrio subtropicus TaxID=1891207 RepID=UPI000B354B67|nr:OmpH family outer membrane protein [Thaumasiovibrio subtropicus]